MRNIKPRLMVGETDYEACTISSATVGDTLTPHFDNHTNKQENIKISSTRRKVTLAIEYHQPLALEDFTETNVPLTSNLVGATKKTPPVMKQKRNPERKQPTFGNNYIMHLYG